MKRPRMLPRFLLLLTLSATALGSAGEDRMSQDMLEVTVPQLQALYRAHRYTVTQVVEWHLARIAKYNGIYRAVQTIDRSGALEAAAREDKDPTPHGALWGVPIVLKANTSVKGLVTTDGWQGYKIPGHELVAPKDAAIVEKLRAAGAIILGQTNMPDFAASDTNRSTAFGRTGNAYDVRFSPGGSSGGTVTAVTANFAILGNGTDTGNSIRMPAATSSVVGVFPTRGLLSLSGIAPLDWLLDNTGPIARTVTDAAIALDVMAGTDFREGLSADALKGKRLGVPAFILAGIDTPFQGIPPGEANEKKQLLQPETRAAFLQSLQGMRAAGATIVIDDSLLPASFADTAANIYTKPFVREGTEKFLAEYGPAQYRSPEAYAHAVGSPLPSTILGEVRQLHWETDPATQTFFTEPQRKALEIYSGTLDRLHLDGYVYPAIQMPPPDETMPQNGVLSTGPHSATAWVNMLGVPAVVVPGGFYPNGLPFGLEISARPGKDGDLLAWAYAYEQATHHRKPPVLAEEGLLPAAR